MTDSFTEVHFHLYSAIFCISLLTFDGYDKSCLQKAAEFWLLYLQYHEYAQFMLSPLGIQTPVSSLVGYFLFFSWSIIAL